jgi:hypothetical protein
MWQGMKKKLTEFYVIRHPSATSFVLAENPQFNRYQWITEGEGNDHVDQLIFETEAQAQQTVQHIEDYKSMTGIISKVILTDE